MIDVSKLSKREAYFMGYVNSYQNVIDRMEAENARFNQIISKWPNGDAIPELKQRVAYNTSQINMLKGKIRRILANGRR